MKLFALTIFCGAFLLFQVQPLIAKFILPWFGGTPAVWTTCMLFFQTFLLAAYAYAHLTVRYLAPRKQALLHIALLLAALAFLPIVPRAHWKPGPSDEPVGHILLLLTVCLGLPYFVLASTSPLLQAWFSRLRPGLTPYRLYALSNVGSLLALVSYPFVFEPALTRKAQASIWAWSFGAFVLLCGACAWRLWRAGARTVPVRSAEETCAGLEAATAPVTANSAATGDRSRSEPAPARSDAPTLPLSTLDAPHLTSAPAINYQLPTINYLLWFLLPFCGSVLLLATTNKLCQDVAVVPFLWVLPLSLYLLTFIICFDSPRWYFRGFFHLLLVPLLALLCYALFNASSLSLFTQIAIYGGSLFVGCMVCHGETYRLRPPPEFLTSFYLLIAAGGAAGGVFVAVLAPLLFQSYAELNWAVWLLGALLVFLHFREQTNWRFRGRTGPAWPHALAWLMGLGVVLCFAALQDRENTVSSSRNFYGVLRVLKLEGNDPPGVAYKLMHGDTTHGMQFADPPMADQPTTYFDEESGVGLALRSFPRQTQRRVGVVGLGVGTLAAYGQRGDTFRFYEINPQIKHLAETRFSYLRRSAARVDVVMGDARLSLEREPPQGFDVLVLDAFSSDAIPVHLLTEEAFTLYVRHLKSDGVIAVHLSNRHLNLFPVMQGIAARLNFQLVQVKRPGDPKRYWLKSSSWALLSRNPDSLHAGPILSAANPAVANPAHAPLWTDDYTSLAHILR